MNKLTKAELKANERVMAWLNGTPFYENSRDKHPRVPELTIEEVQQLWTPPNPQPTGQYYTPPEIAYQLSGWITDYPVLEPCAGIGNLLTPLTWIPDGEIDAFELDDTAFRIGRKLFPEMNWTLGNPFESFDRYGYYESVVMNPPFNIKWGTYEAERWSISGAKKSEDFFMELAIRACVPDGNIFAVLPATYFETRTIKFDDWLIRNVSLETKESAHNLGKFKNTGVNTIVCVLRRK